MSIVTLPGLKMLIDEISQRHNLPKSSVQTALKEALLKGYERYRRSIAQGSSHREDFSDDYFDNFEVELNIEDEGFRILSTKNIVTNAENKDHQISLAQVKEVDQDVQLGDEVVLDVTPEQKDFGRMAAMQTKQVLLQKLRDQQRVMIQDEFKELEGTVLAAKVQRFERQSVIMTVQSSSGCPEELCTVIMTD